MAWPADLTVRLRPHHLLCMLAYAGKGYTPAFTENYDRVMARLSVGEDILVVAGPDDICAALLCEPDCHCHNASILQRDADAAAAVAQLLNRPVAAGETIALNDTVLTNLRTAFAAGTIRKACGAYENTTACEWYAFCTEIAVEEYREIMIRFEGPA